MTDLQDLPGIGAGLAAELRAAGVRDADALRALGPAEAARRVAELGMRDVARTEQVLTEALGETVDARPLTVVGVDNILFAVGDLDRAMEHYATGLALPVAFRLPTPALALLRLGSETPGLLIREDRSMPEAAPSPLSPRVWLEVADADAAAEALRSAGLDIGEPFAVATGRVVEIADPWGNVVGLADYTAAPERGRAQRS